MADLQLHVVTGPELAVDSDLLRATVLPEFEALQVTGRVTIADRSEALWTVLNEAGRDERTVVVALAGPTPDARQLMRAAGGHADRTVWYDLARTGPVEVAHGSRYLYGRGVWGLVWAVRHAVHRLRHPARRIRYGSDPDQWADLRLPAGGAPSPAPVAVLVHGGYWRSIWGADLMDAFAIDLTGRGFATWNLEYRRPDRHGWQATTRDLAAGLAALESAAEVPDHHRVAVIGHSAGGQLALQLAADQGPDRVALAVSLAGVLDLAAGERRWLSAGAVPAALGGTRAELPEVYAAADPLARLPLRVPQLVVQGRDDDPDLVDINRRYARAARAAGDEATYLEQPGDHFAVIDPHSAIWHATAAQLLPPLGLARL